LAKAPTRNLESFNFLLLAPLPACLPLISRLLAMSSKLVFRLRPGKESKPIQRCDIARGPSCNKKAGKLSSRVARRVSCDRHHSLVSPWPDTKCYRISCHCIRQPIKHSLNHRFLLERQQRHCRISAAAMPSRSSWTWTRASVEPSIQTLRALSGLERPCARSNRHILTRAEACLVVDAAWRASIEHYHHYSPFKIVECLFHFYSVFQAADQGLVSRRNEQWTDLIECFSARRERYVWGHPI
jgi:hypothetical protein